MDLPSEALGAPSRVLLDTSSLEASARTVSVMGSAKDLHKIALLPDLRRLWISGVNAKCAEIVGRNASVEDLVIHDLRVPDLRWITDLPMLRSLAIAGSSRLRCLDGIETLARLRSLILFDVSVEDLSPLRALHALDTLSVEGGMSVSHPLRVQTLRPLAELVSLTRLRLASLHVADESLRALHGLLRVRDIFIADSFPPAELRALALALPEARGEWLDTYRRNPGGPKEVRR